MKAQRTVVMEKAVLPITRRSRRVQATSWIRPAAPETKKAHSTTVPATLKETTDFPAGEGGDVWRKGHRITS